jgi:hypothetical protein
MRPALSDLAGDSLAVIETSVPMHRAKSLDFYQAREVGKRGCLRTVEVEHVLENLSDLTPKASSHLSDLSVHIPTLSGPAAGVRIGRALDIRARTFSAAQGPSTI